MIRFYLGEEPILDNVPTYLLSDERARQQVLGRLDELVVKPTSESGGKGVFIGPQASAAEREQQARLIEAQPDRFIAQELVHLSTAPTETGDGQLAPRHVDLRPFAVFGEEIRIVPGGLTRVALEEGSMIVNSSQGGGSKDTWVLDDGERRRPRPRDAAAAPPAAAARRPLRRLARPGPAAATAGRRAADAGPDRPGAVLARPRPDPRRAHRADARRRLPRRRRRGARASAGSRSAGRACSRSSARSRPLHGEEATAAPGSAVDEALAAAAVEPASPGSRSRGC